MSNRDIRRQAESLISEYLRANGCVNTLDQVSSDFPKNCTSEEFQKYAELNAKLDKPYTSVIEYMVAKQLDNADGNEWSSDEVSKLKKAVRAVDDSLEKSERWKQIALTLGTGRSKKECYDKYKDLKQQAKKSRAESKDEGEKSIIFEAKERPLIDQTSEMTIEDVEDDDNDDGIVAPVHVMPAQCAGAVGIMPSSRQTTTGRPITLEEAKQVRQLLFGETKKCFNKDWMTQDLGFGLVQSEGGPCGVLAAVQGYIMRYLMYGSKPGKSFSNPSEADSSKALLNALSRIIWQCGDGRTCHVALHGRSAFQPTNGYRSDGVTERLHLHKMSSELDVKTLINDHIDQFSNKKGAGVVLLVYSCIFSRSIDMIESEMDTATGTTPTLVGAHHYCTQEMVNLLLTGKAVSNVFDGDQTLGDETDAMTLHGISQRSTIGFLTLFEAYEYMKVGSYFKNSTYPIWVVCSESHYSILFSEETQLVETSVSKFDLYYYDGLARQEEPIRLTVDTTVASETSELIPPLNLVIQTKWPNASIDWNSSDPIL